MGRSSSTTLDPGNRVAERLQRTTYGRLARATGLTTSFVSRLLRGQRTPTMNTAMKLATELGVTLEDLFDYIKAQSGAGQAA
jgi:transcriptional regulator with XRE-family HTH domain